MCACRTPRKSSAEISAGRRVMAAPRLVRMVRWASGVTSARHRALGDRAVLEAGDVDAGVPEAVHKGPGERVVSHLADEGRAQAEPRGVERGIGGGIRRSRGEASPRGARRYRPSPRHRPAPSRPSRRARGAGTHPGPPPPGRQSGFRLRPARSRIRASSSGRHSATVRLVARRGSSSISIRIEYSPAGGKLRLRISLIRFIRVSGPW